MFVCLFFPLHFSSCRIELGGAFYTNLPEEKKSVLIAWINLALIVTHLTPTEQQLKEID